MPSNLQEKHIDFQKRRAILSLESAFTKTLLDVLDHKSLLFHRRCNQKIDDIDLPHDTQSTKHKITTPFEVSLRRENE
jgi:hypothetical protein